MESKGRFWMCYSVLNVTKIYNKTFCCFGPDFSDVSDKFTKQHLNAPSLNIHRCVGARGGGVQVK